MIKVLSLLFDPSVPFGCSGFAGSIACHIQIKRGRMLAPGKELVQCKTEHVLHGSFGM